MDSLTKLIIDIEAQSAQAQSEIDKLRAKTEDLNKTTKENNEEQKKAAKTQKDWNDAIREATGIDIKRLGTIAGVTGAIIGLGKATIDTIKETVAYAEQVRDLSRISGQTTKETSRLIQTADDLKVSYETLTMAARTAAKDGIAMTTEELAKLADEYVAIQDPAERAAFALKMFGRNGLEMTKMLEVGGDALRQMAKDQNENLLLSQQQVDAARELEKANDALGDSFMALKTSIGNKAIPVVTDVVNAFNDFFSAEDRANRMLLETSDTFEEYARRVPPQLDKVTRSEFEAIKATEKYANDFERELMKAQNAALKHSEVVGNAFDYMIQKEIELTKNTESFAEHMQKDLKTLDLGIEVTASVDDFTKTKDQLLQEMKNANDQMTAIWKTQTKTLTYEETIQINDWWKTVQAIEHGTGDYQDWTIEERTKKANELKTKIWEIAYGSYLTADQKKQLEEAGNLIDTDKQKLQELIAKQEEWAKNLAWEQLKAQSEGLLKSGLLSPGEAQVVKDNLLKVAEGLGLIDENGMTMAKNLNSIDLTDPTLDLQTILDLIKELNAQPDHTYTITTIQKTQYVTDNQTGDVVKIYTPPEMKQAGGPVAAGETYLVGERGPELFVPSQAGKIIPNNQITNNYSNGASIVINGWTGDAATLAMEIKRREQVERLMA